MTALTAVVFPGKNAGQVQTLAHEFRQVALPADVAKLCEPGTRLYVSGTSHCKVLVSPYARSWLASLDLAPVPASQLGRNQGGSLWAHCRRHSDDDGSSALRGIRERARALLSPVRVPMLGAATMTRGPVFAYTPEQHEREHLRFTCERDGDRFTVRVFGKINAANAKPIRGRLRDALLEGATALVVDLTDVRDIDARGFGELLGAAHDARGANVDVEILNASEDLRTLFELHAIARCFVFRTSPDSENPHGTT